MLSLRFHLLSLAIFGLLCVDSLADSENAPPNFLLITTDDLGRESVGTYGCPLTGITPNIDRLASQGLRFERGHVTIAVCQPCRSVWLTGRYPHRNGAVGFGPIRDDVPTLTAILREAGYRNGILGKHHHLEPTERFAWDLIITAKTLGEGRDPERYGRQAKRFFEEARKAGQPFFLMANPHDPHRPFAGSRQEQKQATRKKNPRTFPLAPRTFDPQEVPVPGFLPDLPQVRKELASYYASVHRADAIVGAVLEALEKSGLAENTVVLFLSDHGMSFPFAKANCYPTSTNVPWIVRWPGKVRPGQRDARHFVSGIDLTPTLLDIAGIEIDSEMDGRSLLPLLRGEPQAERDEVFTVFHETSAKRKYPMRALHSEEWVYIWNGWADGQTRLRNESQAGLTMKAMRRAAESDPALAARVQLFLYRTPEELYRADDRDALHNLADDPEHQAVLAEVRKRLARRMTDLDDPQLSAYQRILSR